ncbi:hypothetical protein ACIQWR_19240 [Streptomyces sp. NPDC098789]|uniref:hypothetical protein n=1 Tax=Streptomyces sp. NPDC098789 TaxID=3366098 RepID=UPI0037FF02E1
MAEVQENVKLVRLQMGMTLYDPTEDRVGIVSHLGESGLVELQSPYGSKWTARKVRVARPTDDQMRRYAALVKLHRQTAKYEAARKARQ